MKLRRAVRHEVLSFLVQKILQHGLVSLMYILKRSLFVVLGEGIAFLEKVGNLAPGLARQ
jgi:hypothetical protein